ncbi:unnamed protein product [Discosporangium mesarthrocarpum]
MDPLPETQGGNTHTFCVVHLFSRHFAMFPLTAEYFKALACAKVLIEKYMPVWGYPHAVSD